MAGDRISCGRLQLKLDRTAWATPTTLHRPYFGLERLEVQLILLGAAVIPSVWLPPSNRSTAATRRLHFTLKGLTFGWVDLTFSSR